MLALYDLAKKASVRDNAVLPVLVIATFFGAVAYVGALAAFGDIRVAMCPDARVLTLSAIKVLIVGSSWILTYCALRTLPITIATPIRASAPAVVILAAIFLYAERPSSCQWVGMVLVLVGFAAFSWAGKAEGIDFRRNRAVWFAVGGMFLSAASSLWDKYVFQIAAASVEPVQFWFQVGLFVFYSVILLIVRSVRAARRRGVLAASNAVPSYHRFEYRWPIPLVGIVLALADWLYFHGLAVPDVPVSVGSLMRRFSVVITFLLGAALFHEHNLRRKGLALSAIVLGTAILCLG